MKNLLLLCCVIMAVIAPAKAQVSKTDFENQIALLRVNFQERIPATVSLNAIRNKLVDMMNQQIDYVNNKYTDKTLNARCDIEKRAKSSKEGACFQLQQLSNTLITQKSSRDAVQHVATNDILYKQTLLLQQLNIFDGTL